MKAYLMNRDVDPGYGVTEWWKTEDGRIFEVDFNVHVRQYDMEHDRVEDWTPLLVRHKDMTGGRAMQELGYEPVEGDGSDGTD